MSPLRTRGMPRSAGQPAPQEPSRPSKMASASQAAGKADKSGRTRRRSGTAADNATGVAG